MPSGVVLVTGASRGIGRSCALALARDGMDVVLWARTAEPLAEVAEICESFGRRARVACVDVADPDAVARAAVETLADLPDLRGLVVNAGAGVWGSLGSLSVADWRGQQGVNLDGAFYTLQAAAPLLGRSSGAQVVAIASDSSLFGYPERSAYCASKAGLIGLMESARRELRGRRIRVTNIFASRVDTFFRGKQPGSRPEALTADEVGDVVAALFRMPDRLEVRELHLSALTTTFGPFPEVAPPATVG